MPDSPPSTSPTPRIAETAAGKILAGLLALFYIFLTTTAAGGEWHTLFLPACFLAAALLLFCFCILRGYKIPSSGLPGWLALGLGGGYFLVRAWFSPWFYYESVADLGLIATAIVMFAAGTYAGAGNGEKSILPVLAASLGLLNALLWGYQNITGTEASWFRPDYSLFGTEIHNIGLFGYKNFSAHFLSVTGFFLCAYSMASARKWGIRLFTGLALILVSFTCGSRSAFPNALAGVTLCFFIYTSSVFRNNRKFYTASILFIILLFLGTSYAVLDLSRGAGRLAALLDTFSFGNRLDLSKLAWALADQAPLFGHGSRMYTNLSTEFFSGANLPNFAHHEYAQAACDYGYAGLGLMLALLALPGCGIKAQALTKDIVPQALDTTTDLTAGGEAVSAFALSLLRSERAGETGLLLSPVSILNALGMTANGAGGTTLKQMETAAGMSLNQLNEFLYTYRMSLPAAYKSCAVSLANSAWVRDTFRVEDSFLRACVNYYSAEVYRSAFDGSLVTDLNRWVGKETNGLIDSLLEQAPGEATMLYLVNAACFDARWETPYEASDIREGGTFTAASGARQTADYLTSSESIYLSGNNVTGFLKPYDGGKYAFVALLPDEGVTLEDYLKNLTGEHLYQLHEELPYIKVIGSYCVPNE